MFSGKRVSRSIFHNFYLTAHVSHLVSYNLLYCLSIMSIFWNGYSVSPWQSILQILNEHTLDSFCCFAETQLVI